MICRPFFGADFMRTGAVTTREEVNIHRENVRPTGGDIAPGGAKLVHALLMRPIGRSQRVVRKEPLR